jgi:hypothetical protein
MKRRTFDILAATTGLFLAVDSRLGDSHLATTSASPDIHSA